MTNILHRMPGRSRVCELIGNARGGAMIEFAITAPFILLILVGTADLGRAFAAKQQAHAALTRTMEMAQVGNGDGTYDYLVAEAAAAAGVPEDKVTLTKWIECDGTKKDFEEACVANEQLARFVELTIDVDYDPIFDGSVFGGAYASGEVDVTVSDTLRIQ